MPVTRSAFLTSILMLTAQLCLAQSAPGNDTSDLPTASGGPGAQNAYPCQTRAASREFDFWQGHWHVTSQGQPAGDNRIESILGGCVLFENWTNVAGRNGKSFNYYDANEKHWRQIWVDDQGNVLEFTGQIRDGKMHYEAVTSNPNTGAKTLLRMTFTPNPDGSVRQFIEQSADQGENWQVAFDGHYVPVPAEESEQRVSAAVEQ